MGLAEEQSPKMSTHILILEYVTMLTYMAKGNDGSR